MRRRCVGFHVGDDGDWVAELECLHGQHQRHQPPFQERPWVTTEEGRASRIGADFDCPLCDRAELPEGLAHARTAGPFDQDTLPAGLRREHRVAARTWGVLRVLEGALTFEMLGAKRRMVAGDEQPIPPEVPHLLSLDGDVRLEVDFRVAPS
jgi:tellurite methyltransferase